jgi:hypothetical protein
MMRVAIQAIQITKCEGCPNNDGIYRSSNEENPWGRLFCNRLGRPVAPRKLDPKCPLEGYKHFVKRFPDGQI